MLGGWTYADFKTCNLPQKVQTGFLEVTSDLVGADYQPLLYVGSQVVNGTNHCILAMQKMVTATPVERIVKMIIREETNGKFSLVSVSGMPL